MNHTLEHLYKHTGMYIVKKKKPRRQCLEMSTGGEIHNVSSNNHEHFRNLHHALHGISEHQPTLPRPPNGYARGPDAAVLPQSGHRTPNQDQKDIRPELVKQDSVEIIDLTLDCESEDSGDEVDIDGLIDFTPQRKSHYRLPRQPKKSSLIPEDNSKSDSKKWKSELIMKITEQKCDDIIDLTDEDRSVDGESTTNSREDIDQFQGAITAIEDDVRFSTQVETRDVNRLAEEPTYDVRETGATLSASLAVMTVAIGSDSPPETRVIEDVNEIYNLFEAHIANIQAEISAYENKSVAARGGVDSRDKHAAFALQHFSDLFIEQQAFRDQIEQFGKQKIKNAAGLVVRARETLTNLKIAYIATRA